MFSFLAGNNVSLGQAGITPSPMQSLYYHRLVFSNLLLRGSHLIVNETNVALMKYVKDILKQVIFFEEAGFETNL
jgi:hypothetical protein